MADPGNEPPALRPLPIPEVIDRALTVYLRTFRRTLPAAVLPFAYLALLHVFYAPSRHRLTYLMEIGAACCYAITVPIMVTIVATAVRGRSVSLWRAVNAVARRSLTVAIHLAPWIVFYFFVYATAMAISAAINDPALDKAPDLSRSAQAFWMGVVLTLGFLIATALAFANLVFILSCAGLLIERLGPVQAHCLAWRRVTRRGVFGRALSVAALNGVLCNAGCLVVGMVLVAIGLAGDVTGFILLTACCGFSLSLGVVFYFDTRIRTEGFDLAVALSELPALEEPAPTQISPAGASFSAD